MATPVTLMGLQLKNPIIVGAGPWARDGRSIQRCIVAGAAAVITESVTLEANANICPRLYYREGQLFNTKLYSNLQLEQWEREIEYIKKGDSKLIFSIWGSSASELSYLASKVEGLGADAIEISISAPIGTRNKSIGSHSAHLREFITSVVEAVGIPVMVKLSYEAAISAESTASIHQAGVEAVSAIDALKGLQGIDIETRRAAMPTYGGYTGGQIHPVSLAVTATLKQFTPFQICSVGGISNYAHVLEFLMLGAEAVQLASVIQLKGYDVITKILEDLEAWLAGHGCEELSEIRGAALPSLRPFEDINPTPLKARLIERCTDECSICRQSCIYQAVKRDGDGAVELVQDACSGCGLCVVRCPARRIELCWM